MMADAFRVIIRSTQPPGELMSRTCQTHGVPVRFAAGDANRCGIVALAWTRPMPSSPMRRSICEIARRHIPK